MSVSPCLPSPLLNSALLSSAPSDEGTVASIGMWWQRAAPWLAGAERETVCLEQAECRPASIQPVRTLATSYRITSNHITSHACSHADTDVHLSGMLASRQMGRDRETERRRDRQTSTNRQEGRQAGRHNASVCIIQDVF